MLLPPPSENRVTDIGYRREEWFAELQWIPNSFPSEADERYIYLNLNEISAGSGQIIPDAVSVPLGGAATGFNLTPILPKELRQEQYTRPI